MDAHLDKPGGGLLPSLSAKCWMATQWTKAGRTGDIANVGRGTLNTR